MSDKPTTPATNPRKPDRVFKAGQVEASIWREDETVEGTKPPTFNVRICRRFWDESSSAYRSSDYFNYPSDLADLILVAQQSYEFTRLRDLTNGSKARPDVPSP